MRRRKLNSLSSYPKANSNSCLSASLLFALLVFFIYSQIFSFVSLIPMTSTTPQLWFYVASTWEQPCKHLKKASNQDICLITEKTPDTNTDKSDPDRKNKPPSMAQWTELPLKSSCFYLHIIIHVLPPSCFFTSIHELTNLRKKHKKPTNGTVAASCCSHWESWQGMKTRSKLGALHVFLNCSERISGTTAALRDKRES